MTFATIEVSLLAVFGLLGAGSLLTILFQWCSGLFDRKRNTQVAAFTAGFEAACQPCRLTPFHGMLPADQEPAAEYTEHSPSHLYFEQVARRFNPDLGDYTCN